MTPQVRGAHHTSAWISSHAYAQHPSVFCLLCIALALFPF